MDDRFPGCRVTWHEDGATFWLARPNKLNAITAPMLSGLADCLDELERRRARWLVVIGEGARAFCAGTDLLEAATMSTEEVDAKMRRARALFHRLATAPAISVAAINGIAYGGGLELAMACTFRVAAPHAEFSLPEIKLGVLPSYGGTQFLPALVGPARAVDLMLTGRSVTAADALTMGLISRLADGTSPLIDQASGLAGLVASYSQVAVDGIRRCVAASGSSVTDEGLAVEDAEVRRTMRSEDAEEGIRAFLEKRKPTFRHR